MEIPLDSNSISTILSPFLCFPDGNTCDCLQETSINGGCRHWGVELNPTGMVVPYLTILKLIFTFPEIPGKINGEEFWLSSTLMVMLYALQLTYVSLSSVSLPPNQSLLMLTFFNRKTKIRRRSKPLPPCRLPWYAIPSTSRLQFICNILLTSAL